MDSWKRKLRMGMVGGGEGAFIGGVHRIVATMDLQIEIISGCFGRDPENTRRTGEALYLDPQRCYDNYHSMADGEAALPEGERIDFVTIVTPNHLHFDIARTFLEAGIHVVCDKPMTYTLEEAEELVELEQSDVGKAPPAQRTRATAAARETTSRRTARRIPTKERGKAAADGLL